MLRIMELLDSGEKLINAWLPQTQMAGAWVFILQQLFLCEARFTQKVRYPGHATVGLHPQCFHPYNIPLNRQPKVHYALSNPGGA